MPSRLLLATLLSASLATAQAPVTLTSGRLAVTLDPAAKGGPTALRDVVAGRELLANEAAPRLFVLTVVDQAGAERTLTNHQAARVSVALDQQQGRLSVTASSLDGLPIEVICTVAGRPTDRDLTWGITVTLPPGLRLLTVRYPVLVLRAPLAVGSPEALVSGAAKGGVAATPSSWPAGRWQGWGLPGSLAAQFGCYYDTTSGLATAALDPVGHPKTFAATRTAAGLELAWLRQLYASGEVDCPYPLVTTGFDGDGQPADWRHAADWYKAWAVTQPWCERRLEDRDDLPDWLLAGPVSVRFNRSWLARPEAIEQWLTGYWQRHFAATAPLLVTWWGWEKVDTWVTPDYFPVYPDDATFARLAAAVRSVGGRNFFWPSGYHYTLTYDQQPDGSFRWDDRERFEREFRPHAIVNRDGTLRIGPRSWLRGGETATLCPGDPWTIAWFNQIGAECARRGVELVQVDQVVGAGFPPCYSTEHGHPPGPGPWMTAVMQEQMRSLLAVCQAIEPEAVVGFEEPNELFLQQVGIQDYRDWEVMRRDIARPASVFGYLYHEYLPLFQSNPIRGDLLQTAWSIADGQMPHLSPGFQDGPGPALVNGAFETWAGGSLWGWEKVAGYQGQTWTGLAAPDADGGRHGTTCLKLTNRADDEVVQVSQNVPVGGDFVVGGRYRLSAWIRTADLAQPARIGLGTFAPGMKSTGSAAAPIAATPEWQFTEAVFDLPEGSALLRIMIHVVGPGTVWVDDVQLEVLDATGAGREAQRSELPPGSRQMREWVALYHGAGRRYLQFGRQLHPPPLRCATIERDQREFPAILHNAFAASDGSQAVVLANATAAPQTGWLTWAGQERSVALEPEEVRLLTE